jgi:phosphoesterase RecJ-like protein
MKISNLKSFCYLLNKNLKSASKILIISHLKPDPDCLFSQLSLYYLLKSQFKNKEFVLYNKDYLYEKDNLKLILDDLKIIKNRINDDLDNFDLIIGIEITDENRFGLEQKISNYQKVFIIDHHQSFSLKKANYYLDKNSESCSIIIYKIAKYFKFQPTLNFKISIWGGIIGDTVGLRYIKNKNTFKILEEIYDKKINIFKIIKNIYGFTYTDFKKIFSLLNKIKFKIFKNKKLLLIYFDNKKIKKLSSFIEYLRLIKDIETIVILNKKGDQITGSLRSENVDVNLIAKALGGGGHKNSSGFTSSLPLRKIVKYILSEIK